jgi:hypothetical protein
MTGAPIFAGLTPHHYAAILADPPWDFRTWSAKGTGRGAVSHYDTPGFDELVALPVADLEPGLFDNGPVRTRRRPSSLHERAAMRAGNAAERGKRMGRSFGIVPLRAAADRRLGVRGLRLLIAICGRANRSRVAEASLSELAQDSGIDRRGVPIEVKKLVAAGYILHAPGTRGRKSRFTVLVDPSVSCEDVAPDTSGRDGVSCPDMPNVTPGRDTYRESPEKETDAPFGSESRARTRESASSVSKIHQGHLPLPINGGASVTSAHQFHHGGSNGQTRIPVDWSPGADDREYAHRREGWDDERIDDEVENFRNHYLAKPGDVLADCSATWRLWVGRDKQFNGHRGSPQSAKPGPEDITVVVGKIMSRRRMEGR